VRERLKEPRKGSEIDPEIVCVQGVGAGLSGDSVLFVERSSELFTAASLRHLPEAQWKRAWIGRQVVVNRPETGWPNHGQAEAQVKLRGGPNRSMLQNARMTCG